MLINCWGQSDKTSYYHFLANLANISTSKHESNGYDMTNRTKWLFYNITTVHKNEKPKYDQNSYRIVVLRL